ncbi:MAG: acyl-CoA thioesterase [Deltaproteobacteria bacterium]|nr:acyl-CoA thioesterase [Deltaproteobacteria bacterium]
MAFETTIRARFGDEDHAGIVYYPRFLDYFHRVFEDFFESEGRSYRQVLDQDGVGWPAVHLEVDFRSPLRFGDDLVVTLSALRVGEKSAVFRYRGAVGDRDVVSAEVTVACIDMKSFRGVALPEFYRHMFERHLSEVHD